MDAWLDANPLTIALIVIFAAVMSGRVLINRQGKSLDKLIDAVLDLTVNTQRLADGLEALNDIQERRLGLIEERIEKIEKDCNGNGSNS